jgi:hypothetical protein
VLGFSLTDLALVPTRYPNFTQAEIERYGMMLDARINSFLRKPQPKPCTYVDVVDVDGQTMQVVGRGKTLSEAQQKARDTAARLYPIDGEKAA